MPSGNSGAIHITGTKSMFATCYWSETYNTANNTHVVSIDGLTFASGNWYQYTYFLQGSIAINGQTVAVFNSSLGTHHVRIDSQYDEYPIEAAAGYATPPYYSGTIYGSADGSCSVNISVTVYGYTSDGRGANGFCTDGWQSVSLYTIPRKSSCSLSATELGSAGTVSITRASSAFTHTLTYSFGNATGTIATKTAATSVSWTPPISLAEQLPNSTSGTVTITCLTYSGNTQIGSSTCTATLSVPASVAPSFSSLSASRIDGDVPSSWGIYVQTKSKAMLTVNGAAGSYGSTVTAYSITGGGYVGTMPSLMTGFLNSSGSILFTAKVQDSRGRWSEEKTVSVSVEPYSPPSFTKYLTQRCNSSGTVTANGTYARGLITFAFSSCGNRNSVSTAVAYKRSTDTYYTETSVTFVSGTAFLFGGGNLSTEYSYDVRYTLTDVFGSVIVVDSLPTASVLMDFKAGGTGIAVGKVSEHDNFECAWDAEFGKKLKVNHLDDILIGDVPLSEYIRSGGVQAAYPVGSLFISTVSTNPSVLLGFGRWERIQDRFLLAAGPTYAAGTTGGTATHTHTTGSHTLTMAELPSANLDVQSDFFGSMQAMCLGLRASLGSGWDIGTIQSSDDYALKARLPGGGQGHSHGDTGSKNHLPPYLAVYVWKRLPD